MFAVCAVLLFLASSTTSPKVAALAGKLGSANSPDHLQALGLSSFRGFWFMSIQFRVQGVVVWVLWGKRLIGFRVYGCCSLAQGLQCP